MEAYPTKHIKHSFLSYELTRRYDSGLCASAIAMQSRMVCQQVCGSTLGADLYKGDSAELVDGLGGLSRTQHGPYERRHEGLHVMIAHHAAHLRHSLHRRRLRGESG